MKATALRALSIPGRDHGNRYFELSISALERQGIVFMPTTAPNLALLNFDVLHLNFPSYYITQYGPLRATLFFVFFWSIFTLARGCGRAIVFTVHNVTPHATRNEWLLWPYLRFVHRITNGYVFLSSSSRAALLARYPSGATKPWVLAPHGPYPVRLCHADALARSREFLGVGSDDFLVGFLGRISEYKGLGEINLLPKRLRDGRLVKVVVAGKIDRDLREADQILRQTTPGQLIRVDGSPSDDELDTLMQAVDVVLLPYKSGWNSGAALRALSNHARIICSDLIMFIELSLQLGNKWITILVSDARFSPAERLREAIERIATTAMTPEDHETLDRFLASVAFPASAKRVRELYERVCGLS